MGCCEHSNALLGFVKGAEFLEKLLALQEWLYSMELVGWLVGWLVYYPSKMYELCHIFKGFVTNQ